MGKFDSYDEDCLKFNNANHHHSYFLFRFMINHESKL